MKTQINILTVLFTGLLAWSTRAADVNGTWLTEFDTPVGHQKYVFNFTNADGKITATADATSEDQPRKVTFTEVKWEASTISFVESLKFQDNDLRIEYTGQVGTNEIQFNRKVGDFATEDFVAKRVQSTTTPAPAATTDGALLPTLAAAIQALNEKANYSWTSTNEIVDAPFPPMVTRGQTEREGFTILTAEGQDGEIEAVKKGDKGVLKTEDVWQTAEEYRQANQGGQGPGRGFAGRLLTQPVPVEDAEDLLKGLKDLKADDDGLYTAELTDQAAKDNAGFFGRQPRQGAPGGFTPPEPKDAKGTVKFWVKAGLLIKFELHTSAKITFQDEDHDINRTATTEISDVGSTKIEVPDAAKSKL